jgi:hypothetical protein
MIEKDGPREGQTGVVFRPSITAGDIFTLRAYLDVSATLDADADVPPSTPAAEVGSFSVWRGVTLARRYRKCANVEDRVPDPRPYYNPAFIRFDDQLRTNAHVLTKSEYDHLFTRALTLVKAHGGIPSVVMDYSLPDGVSQYDYPGSGFGRFVDRVVSFFGGSAAPTTWVATFRSWDDFVDAVARGRGCNRQTALAKLQRAQVPDSTSYAKSTELFAVLISIEFATLVSRDPGVAVLQFEQVHSLQGELGWRVDGVAAASIGQRDRTAFVAFSGSASTFAHEIGHCLFLPHAPSQPGTPIEGVVANRHVGGITDCLMAYGNTRELCALCLLRLRGCNGYFLNQKGVIAASPPPVIPPAPIIE